MCPLLSNPITKQAFDELTNLFGEDIAYFLWSKNGGYPLDKAPNGASSILFASLAEHYGDRKQALIAKAKTFSKKFTDWFGDWTDPDAINVSKAVDINGEPQILWHGTKYDFEEFQYDEKYERGSHKFHDLHSFFFTDSEEKALKYGHHIAMPVYLNLRNPGYSDVTDGSSKTKEEYLSDENAIIKDDKYDSAIFVRYDKEGGEQPIKQWAAKYPNQIKSIKNNGDFSTQTNIYKSAQQKKDPNIGEKLDKLDKWIRSTQNLNNWALKSNSKKEQIKREIRSYFNSLKIDGDILFAYDRLTHKLYWKVSSPEDQSIKKWMNAIYGTKNSYNIYSDKSAVDTIIDKLITETKGSSYEITNLVKALADAVKKSGIQIVFRNTNLAYDDATHYDYFTNSIVVNTNSIFFNNNKHKDVLTQTLIHELIHAVTVNTLQRNKELYDKVDSLRKLVKSKLGEKAKDYGLSDAFEFLAELSNIDFVNKLKQIKTEKKPMSILLRINSIIRSIAGAIFNTAVLKHNGTAYADAVNFFVQATYPENFNTELSDSTLTDQVYYNANSQTSTSSQQNVDTYSQKIIKMYSDLQNMYEKMPNKSLSRQKIQNELFESINEMIGKHDSEVIKIALSQTVNRIGIFDSTGKPENDKSMLGFLYKSSSLQDPFSNITPDLLVDMFKNSISFYDKLLNEMPDVLENILDQQDLYVKDQLIRSISSCKNLWKQALNVVTDRLVDRIVDNEFIVGKDDVREQHKQVLRDYLHKNLIHKDINDIQQMFEYSSMSSNPIIKIMYDILSKAEMKATRESENSTLKLRRAFKRCHGITKMLSTNWQTKLMEFNDGVPTGYLIRPINYGKYQQNLQKFVENLNVQFDNQYGHHYIIDENTKQYVNSATGTPAEQEVFIGDKAPDFYNYLLQIEKWKCENSERRYNFDYYKERMSTPYQVPSFEPSQQQFNEQVKTNHGLSPKTLFAYNRIQSNINYYLDKCTDDNGLSHVEELQDDDFLKLEYWNDQLQELSNIYAPDGSVKTDDGLKMAYEIRAWTTYVNQNTDINIYQQQFDAERNFILSEAQKTGDYSKLQKFDKYNSEYRIDPRYVKLYTDQLSKLNVWYSVYAQYVKSSLLHLIKQPNSIERDIRKVENIPGFWTQLKTADTFISAAAIPQHTQIKFEQMFDMVPQPYRDSQGRVVRKDGTTLSHDEETDYYTSFPVHDQFGIVQDIRSRWNVLTYFDYMIDKYINRAKQDGYIDGYTDSSGNVIDLRGKTDSELYDIVYDFFTYDHVYFDKYGNRMSKRVPLSAFNVMYPVQDTFLDPDSGKQVDVLRRVPKGRFTQKNNLRFFNNQYDITDNNSEQPKAYDDQGNRLYYNEDSYDECMKDPNMKYLYDTIVQIMKEASEDYSSKNSVFNYKIPKYETSELAYISRIFKQGYSLSKTKDFMVDKYLGQTTMDEDVIQQGDNDIYGLNVPLRHIGQLEDKTRTSYDVTSAVLLYVNMAKNYKYKKEVESQILSLRYALSKENRDDQSNAVPRSEAAADNLINSRLYSNVYDSMDYKYIKLAQQLAGALTKRMLGLNILSMFAGFADSMRVLMRDSLVGNFMTTRDFACGFMKTLMHIPLVLANGYSNIPNCKFTALMRRYGISKSFIENNNNVGEGIVVRMLKSVLMGGFSILDYVSNMMLMRSFMHHVRFYDGNDIPKGFYTKYSMQQAFIKAGKTVRQANLAYFMTYKTLYDAYDYVEGAIYVKSPYEQYVNDDIENHLRNKVFIRGGLINGTTNQEDTPQYKRKIWGIFIGALRGWISNSTQEKFSGRDDTSAREIEEIEENTVKNDKTHKKIRTKLKPRTKEQEENRMSWNYAMEMPQPEEWKGCWRYLTQLFKKIANAITLGQIFKGKTRKFSRSESYAMKQFMIELAMISALVAGIKPMFEFSKDSKPAGNGKSELIYTPQEYMKSELYKKQLYNIYIRTTVSALEQASPFQALEVVKTATALSSGMDTWIGTFTYAGRIFGVQSNDKLKTGSYKGFTAADRDLYKATAIMDNLHKGFTYNGVEANTKFYTDTFLNETMFLNMLGVDFSELNNTKKKGISFNDLKKYGGDDSFEKYGIVY